MARKCINQSFWLSTGGFLVGDCLELDCNQTPSVDNQSGLFMHFLITNRYGQVATMIQGEAAVNYT
jgi:hypothetical protein